MSGGVDSSVTAWLLREQGYDVEGLSLLVYEARIKGAFPGCCSLESIRDAKKTADGIGVAHAVRDVRNEFLERVIEPFIDAYGRGVTPNPCILCNRFIKFPHLLRYADERGAGLIATGHYARVEKEDKLQVTSDNGRNLGDPSLVIHRPSRLLKGIDPKKDQSYVLYVLRPEELERLVLPLGEKRKDEVRAVARTLHLPAAERPESQEICFVGDGNYSRFIGGFLAEDRGPGEIIDATNGKVLGVHKGIHRYTIGQRKGLQISSPEPCYVVRIDRDHNAVYVGPREAALKKEFMVQDVHWLMRKAEMQRAGSAGGEDPFGRASGPRIRASVKVRSTMRDEPADLFVTGRDRLRVVYDAPQWAPAPGQSAVFYEGDSVIGGGVISAE